MLVVIRGKDPALKDWRITSGNIIDASYNALHDAITYKLLLDGLAER